MPIWSQALPHLRWQDAADVGVLTLVLALAYRWLRGTVAIQVAVAIASVLIGAWLARQVGLAVTSDALSALGAISAVAVVVIFKDEIRRGLSRFSLRSWWRAHIARRDVAEPWPAIAAAMFALGPRRIGALVVVPRRDDISGQLTGGSSVDGLVTAALLEAIFTSDSPLHDGACIVSGGRLVRAGVVLPLSSADLPESFGTRHRAALGLAEITDAIVVCVSEERGEVSVAADGVINEVSDATRLVATLADLCRDGGSNRRTTSPTGNPKRDDRLGRRRVIDAFAYVTILIAVSVAWSARAFDRSHAVARSVSLEFRGLDDRVGFEPPDDKSVVVELRGPKQQIELLPPGRVVAFIDLSHVAPGRHLLPVGATAPDGIRVVSVIPASIEVEVLERRTVPVQLSGISTLSGDLRVIAIVPSSVQLVGSPAAFRNADVVTTAPLGRLTRPGNVEVAVTVPKGLRLVDSRHDHVLAVVASEPHAAAPPAAPRGRSR